jgi:hypothetical protein
MNETVTLEWFEIEVASKVGLSRCIENHRQNIGYGWNYDKNFEIGVKDSVQGALAEQAFAKKLNIYYSSHVNYFNEPDLKYNDKNIQIRSQTPKKTNFLIVRPNAKDNDIYVLIINRTPEFIIAGGLTAREAKKPEFLTDFGLQRPKVYAVPLEKLKDVTQLL